MSERPWGTFPRDEVENRDWNEAMVKVCGLSVDDLFDEYVRGDQDHVVAIVMAAYEDAVERGLMESGIVDGEKAYRLTPAGFRRLAVMEGALLDAQCRYRA